MLLKKKSSKYEKYVLCLPQNGAKSIIYLEYILRSGVFLLFLGCLSFGKDHNMIDSIIRYIDDVWVKTEDVIRFRHIIFFRKGSELN